MLRRSVFLLVSAVALAGCMPRVPRIDLGGVTLPKMELFRYGVADPDVSTVPYKLSKRELAAVKDSFAAEFTDGRTLTFGPIGARRGADGALTICGLVSVRNLDASETGMKLFDGTGAFTPDGTLRFSPHKLAGANGKFLDIYTRCRNLGVI